MKKILLLLFVFPFTVDSFSQNLSEKLSDALYQIGKEIPSDQLFLHLDRNLYHSGDTIWFQAYVRESRTGLFTTESSSLYALLLNSDHVTIDSARFRIVYAGVAGWLKVPEDIPHGDYSVLAFTSLDMNYSPEYAFNAPIKIENILPLSGKNKSESTNEAAHLNEIPIQQPQIDLRFLPEGGTFISGIHQRLAFNAVRSDGNGLEVKGEIINQRDERIAEFRSSPFGPGFVEFTPIPGDSYFAAIDGKEFKGVKWSLPAHEKSGICMQVNNAGDGITDIILRGREISRKSWFLTVTMNNILVFSEGVTLDTLYRKRIQTDKLPSGTAFISLYDGELNPVAERLVFLNEYKKMNVEIRFSPQFIFPDDETELTLNTTDTNGNNISSIISVAVIDSLSGYSKEILMPDIEAAYLYERDFYNNLPFKIKSQGMENIDSKSVDLLLMTFGWRSFHPKEIAIDNSEKELVNYDFVKITNPGSAKKSRSDIKLTSNADVDILSLPVNDNREAELFYDSLNAGVRQIMILPDKTPAKNTTPVRVLFPENKEYTDNAKLLAPDKSCFDPDLSDTINTQPGYDISRLIVIESVTIKAPKQQAKKYEDKYAKMFQYAESRTLTSDDFREASSFEDILYKSNPFFLNTNNWYISGMQKEIYLRANEHTKVSVDGLGNTLYNSEMIPALIVVDDNPIGKSYEMIATMPANEIASVTFLKGQQGFSMYGNKANGGVVFVTTKMAAGIDGTYTVEEVRRDDDLLKQIRLFRTETEYYIPTKEEVAHIPEFHFRPTILWKADLFIDGSGPVKIKYPNNLAKGTVMIFVNGISVTNLIGSGKSSYRVQ